MFRRGFALLELLVVVGMLAIIAGFSLPLYRNYRTKTDLAIAKNQIVQGLQRAKINSETGKNDSQWGFFVPNGTLFKGASYDTRDQAKDEVYPMPDGIITTGLTQVVYNRKGVPDVTGSIDITPSRQNPESIVITVVIDKQSVSATVGDAFMICKNGNTLTVSEAAWPTYQAQGAKIGPCR